MAWRTEKLGANHPHTQNSKESLAFVYWDQGKYDLAGPLLREAVEAASRDLGLGNPRTQGLVDLLIQYCDRFGHKVEAAKWRKALEDQKNKP